jgi:hypothetical protein
VEKVGYQALPLRHIMATEFAEISKYVGFKGVYLLHDIIWVVLWDTFWDTEVLLRPKG